jgi:SpoVK/Ycf46/Vps4 family AAA+-type ATPase
VTQDALKGGMTAQTAAKVGLVDLEKDEEEKRVNALRAHLGAIKEEHNPARTLGSAEFSRSLLDIKPKSLEEIAKKQLDEAVKAVAKLEEVRLQLKDGVMARVGPPGRR